MNTNNMTVKARIGLIWSACKAFAGIENEVKEERKAASDKLATGKGAWKTELEKLVGAYTGAGAFKDDFNSIKGQLQEKLGWSKHTCDLRQSEALLILGLRKKQGERALNAKQKAKVIEDRINYFISKKITLDEVKSKWVKMEAAKQAMMEAKARKEAKQAKSKLGKASKRKAIGPNEVAKSVKLAGKVAKQAAKNKQQEQASK
jgi:hypothetical protein